MAIWSPQKGPQKALIDCPLPEIFYGGARGGGKTDGVLGKYAIKMEMYGKYFNGVFFRQEVPMLDDAIERSKDIFEQLGCKWQDQKRTWRHPTGCRLRFRPLESIKDADKYQGQNVTDACVEEAGIYPDPGPIDRLNGVLRSASGIPTQLLLTGNPGGAGQGWIKERYIDPNPNGMQLLTRDLPNGFKHRYVFIPSQLKNNRILMANDPNYVNRLYLVGSKALVEAWLNGDWNAVEGAYFDCWDPRMVIRPVSLPDHWLRFRSFDWGSAKPFSVGWWALASEDFIHPDGFVIPKGAMVRYREWYGAKSANVGLKMTAEQVSDGILERENERIDYSVADPSIFSEDGGPSIAERMLPIAWVRADNKRVAHRGGQLGGWDQMRSRMIGENGKPMIYCFNTCKASIRTIPTQQHSDIKPEDLDTNGEDHAADEWRYACMSRPYTRKLPQQEPDEDLDAWGRKRAPESWKTR